MSPALLALIVLAPSHSRSEGRSSFVVDDTGRVKIVIRINAIDVPDLCNADMLSQQRDQNQQKLAQCLQTSLPVLLRLKGDNKPCPLTYEQFTLTEEPLAQRVAGGTVLIRAAAACDELPRVLVVDWGLFATGDLDHVSVAKIERPHEKPALAMLSKRNARLTLDIARPLWPWLLGALSAISAITAGALLIRRRRRLISPRAQTHD